MPYDEREVYTPYLDSTNTSNCPDECSCCPEGLVAVYNTDGKHIGCLTANDAQEYNANNVYCSQGFLALYKNGVTPQFIGCVTQEEFIELYQALNPT